ncbi:MAG TPA: hypothetical protein VGN72_01395 [Tepidisphaeraceae bacterium]|nr:hypothetical protein [Tepidisphaeraceae bacterium]
MADAQPVATVPTPSRRQRQRRAIIRHVTLLSVLVVTVLISLKLGLDLRRWTYEHTGSIRHTYDVHHNLLFGTRAMNEGVLDLYGNVIEATPSGNYRLDYVPLRLLTMRLWAGWVNHNYGYTAWRPEYEFTRPLLQFNAMMEGASALAIFLLVRLWVRRSDRAMLPPLSPEPKRPLDPWRGCFLGLAGALLMWFNPASHVSSQTWPSWDIWIVPFYLYTVLLASLNWWFTAGVVLGIGTMFKGQHLMVVALFLLWPLFMGQAGAALRWAAGYLFAAALIVAPWLLRDETTREPIHAAWIWIASAIAACGVMAGAQRFLRDKWWGWAAAGPVAVLLLTWPWMSEATRGNWLYAFLVACGVVLLGWRVPLAKYAYLVAGIIGLSLAACPLLFNSDLTWWDLAFRYGAEKFPSLVQFSANTVPTLLGGRFGWSSLNEVVYSFEAGQFLFWSWDGYQLRLKQTLVAIYAIGIVLCAFAMARHTRHGDRRFLAAAATPWLIAFTFMPQMHSRYLLFTACIGMLMTGVGLGMTLLAVLISLLSWMMTLHLMFGNTRFRGPMLRGYLPVEWADPVRDIIVRSHPDAAWAILLLTLIFLYTAMRSSPDRPRRPWVARISDWRRARATRRGARNPGKGCRGSRQNSADQAQLNPKPRSNRDGNCRPRN